MLKTTLTGLLLILGCVVLAGCEDDINANTGDSGIRVGAGHEPMEAAESAHATTMPSNTPGADTSAGTQAHPGTEKH